MGRTYTPPPAPTGSPPGWRDLTKYWPNWFVQEARRAKRDKGRSARNATMTQEMRRRGHLPAPPPQQPPLFRPDKDPYNSAFGPGPRANPANKEIYDKRYVPDKHQSRFQKPSTSPTLDFNAIINGVIATKNAQMKKAYDKANLPQGLGGDSTAMTLAKELENFNFTGPEIMDQWERERNPEALAKAKIDARILGLTNLGTTFAQGAERIKNEAATTSANDRSYGEKIMGLTAGFAPNVEEETPAVRAAAMNQGQAQNAAMATRAQTGANVMSQLDRLDAASAQSAQNSIASGKAEATADLPGEIENQKRAIREELRQKYALLRAAEEARYGKIKDKYTFALKQQELDDKAASGGVSANTLYGRQNKVADLESDLIGTTQQATDKFGQWLSAYRNTKGNQQARMDAANKAMEGYGDASLSPDANDLYNAVVRGYINSGGRGVTRNLRSYYRQKQGPGGARYGDPAAQRELIDRYFWSNPESQLKRRRR